MKNINEILTNEEAESLKTTLVFLGKQSIDNTFVNNKNNLLNIIPNLHENVFIHKIYNSKLNDWLVKNRDIGLFEFLEYSIIKQGNKNSSGYDFSKTPHFINEYVLKFFISELKENHNYDFKEQFINLIINGPMQVKGIAPKIFKCYLDLSLILNDKLVSAKMVNELIKNNYESMEFVKKEKIRPIITKKFKDFINISECDVTFIEKIINNNKIEIKDKDGFSFKEITSIKVNLDFHTLTQKYVLSQRTIDEYCHQFKGYLNTCNRDDNDFFKFLGINKLIHSNETGFEFEYDLENKELVTTVIEHMFTVLDKLIKNRVNINNTNLKKDLEIIAKNFNLNDKLNNSSLEIKKSNKVKI